MNKFLMPCLGDSRAVCWCCHSISPESLNGLNTLSPCFGSLASVAYQVHVSCRLAEQLHTCSSGDGSQVHMTNHADHPEHSIPQHKPNLPIENNPTPRDSQKKTKSRLHEQQAALLFIRMLLNWRTLNKRCTQKPNCHNCHNCRRYSYTPCESNACQLVLLEFASVEASWPSAGTAAVVAVDFAASAVVAAAAVSLCLPASSEALVSTMEGSSLPHPQHCLHLEACL